MGINLQKLDGEIAKLEKLKRIREMLADPETAAILEEVLSTNGNHGMAREPGLDLFGPSVAQAKTVAPPSGMRGSLLHTAIAAAKLFKNSFTSRHFHDQMEAMGFKFQAKDHMIAVNGVLNKLEGMGLIQKVEQGMGRRPNVYKSTGK